MPFTPENASEYGKLGARQPYTLEQEQLEKMRSILDKDLDIAKRIQDQEEISPQDEKRLSILQARINKYMDKLHVSKTTTDITTGGKELSALLVKFVDGVESDIKKHNQESLDNTVEYLNGHDNTNSK